MVTEPMGERGRQGAAPLGGTKDIKTIRGVLLTPRAMTRRDFDVADAALSRIERVVEAARSFVDFTETGQYRNNEGSKAYMFNRLREALEVLDARGEQ